METLDEFSDDQIEGFLRTGEHAEALRDAFGDALYADLVRTARQMPAGPALLESTKRKVFVLPGIMGSKLSRPGMLLSDKIWIDVGDLATGGVDKLDINADDSDEIFASGVLLSAYLRMKMRLGIAGFDAEFLPYDWRLAPADIGAALLDKLKSDGVSGAGLVGHSMGGLVARAMAALDPDRAVVNQVITVGTPNHGSYSPVQVYRLNHSMLVTLGRIDLVHSPKEIAQDVLRHFPSLLQMMPDPEKRPGERYFEIDGWPNGGVRPLKRALEAALQGIRDLAPVDERFSQIIGVGEDTILSARIEGGDLVYQEGPDGDGTVPRDLAEQGDVPRYYYEGSHAWLCNQLPVIRAVRDILRGGTTDELPTEPPAPRALESMRPTLTEAELRRRAELVADDVERAREEDVLSGFVSPRFDPDPDHGAAAPPISMPAPSIRTPPRGTPIELMERALQNWTGAGKERAKVEAALDKGRPLEAEDPERLRKYARRQIELLGRATVHEAPELRDPLRESLREVSSIMAAEAATPDSALALERVIGQAEEFFSVMFMKRATMVLRSVGRIIERRGQRRGFGTGFLIAPGVLMTNHHVLDTAFAAENASVQFHYELDVDRSELSGHIFHLRPDLLFEADKALDFAVVAVEPTALDSTPLATFGHLPLVEAIGKIRVGQNVNIIQHPEGDRKQVVFRESVLKVLPKNPDTVAHYTGDTKPGSSGSPVFSDNWEVVALHHSGVPATDADGNWLMRNNKPFRRGDDVDEIKWIANEGIRISRIVARLKLMHEQEMGPAGRPGRALLGEVLSVGERARKLGPFYTPPGMERAPATVPEPPRPRPTPAPVSAMQETADPYEAAESAPMPSEETAPTVTAPGGSISVTLPLTVTLGFGSADGAVATMPAPVPGPALHLHRGPGAPAPDTQESRRRPEDYDDRTGFDRDFLGPRVEMPTAGPALRASIATLTGSSETELRYDHFSVLMHRDRRLAAVAAGNFRTDAPFKASRRDPWGFDPRLPRAVQLGNDAYRNNDLDRGHLFRRADGAWGESAAEARRASDDTFHWTNIAPQHKVFNQSGEDPNLSVWGLLENHLVRETEAESRRMSVFNGPIFADHDPLHRGVAVPQAFWKLAVVRGRDGALRAFAFVLGQQSLLADLPAEAFDAGRFAVFQVQIREIESRTGLDFGALQQADVLVRPGAAESFGAGLAGRRITDLAEIVKD